MTVTDRDVSCVFFSTAQIVGSPEEKLPLILNSGELQIWSLMEHQALLLKPLAKLFLYRWGRKPSLSENFM